MRVVGVALLILVAMFDVGSAAQAADSFPSKPVHIVVGFPPGGGSDSLARVLAQQLSTAWGQPVVVDNRPGADGSIANDYVAQAAPDGYTICLLSTNLTIPTEGYTPNYDPVKSFAPITLVANVPDVLVVNAATVPAKNLKEFIEFAKTKPGKLNFGSGGIFQFLQMAVLMDDAGIKMVNVNYKGGSPAMTAVLGDEVQSMFGSVSAVNAQVKAGNARALAIGGLVRSPAMPDVPTFAEADGLSDMGAGWYGMVAPAGTPADVVQKIHEGIVKAMQLPDVKKSMDTLGYFPVGGNPDEFSKLIQGDVVKWQRVTKEMSGTQAR